MSKPILCVDFDGVIHSYEKGWQNGEIYGSVTEGFFEWAVEAAEHFDLIIYSSRSKTPEGIAEMEAWLTKQQKEWHERTLPMHRYNTPATAMISFAHEKPPAFLTIDDRAIQFEGNWQAGYLHPKILLKFKPWMQK